MASRKAKSLVIVESPTKTRTLSRLLGDDYKIMASVGHVADLPVKELGVDVENNFEPKYVTIRGKGKVLSEIKKAAQKAERVYLAPDPDREGEAIAWHVAHAIDQPDEKVFRITFDEITRRGVERGLAEPRKIDMNRFEAQQARRILDRLVGYKISPILWKKVRRGLSAGRVQSVAVRLVCEREAEIRAFNPEEYWSIDAEAEGPEPPPFPVALEKIDGEKARIPNGDEARRIVEAVTGQTLEQATEKCDATLRVVNVDKKEVRRHPSPPFITSTLQQDAARKLRFTARQTMRHAQMLYEGVDVGNGQTVGLITYMRTDSTRVAGEAIDQARQYISGNFDSAYLPEKPNFYRSKKGAQDAHEAIRPTDTSITPDRLKGKVDESLWKLYELIWLRFVASQMASARFEQTRAEAVPADERYLFVAKGQVPVFKGFLALYEEGQDDAPEKDDDRRLPPLNPGDALRLTSIAPNQHFTQPPPRFTEATLVRELERRGIGRPSTYASIISVIQDKEYVVKDRGRFQPTELGEVTNELLVESFPRILDIDFTAEMENHLDEVEEGDVEWHGLLERFYGEFQPMLEEAQRNMKNMKAHTEETDIPCDKCGAMMHIRWGRNGKFLSCSKYPECKNAKPLPGQEDGQERVQIELGADPETKETVYAMNGPFGPYVQLGEVGDKGKGKSKPKRVSLSKDKSPKDVDLDYALRLLALPRDLGKDPESGKVVKAGVGRYGPYVVRDGVYRNLSEFDKVFTVTLEEALGMLAEAPRKRGSAKKVIKELGEHPESGKTLQVLEGRYGPYVTDGKVNATIPKGTEPASVEMAQAVELLKEAEARKKKKSRR